MARKGKQTKAVHYLQCSQESSVTGKHEQGELHGRHGPSSPPCLSPGPPSAVPMESIPKDALGHSKDFPSQGPRQALLASPEELPRQEQLNPTGEAVHAIWGKETWSSPPREGHLLVMARAMSCTSLLLPGRKISVA